MTLLKVVEEYRADSEAEVKEMNDKFKNEARTAGYALNAFSYTKKEKKAKGNIVDECYVVKATKIFGGVWDGIDN